MKKIVIIIVSLFLLLSAVNFGTSKPILNNDSTSEMDYSIDSSVIDNAQEQQILQNINRLDGYFTENHGQVGNDSVRYYIQGKSIWFLDDGLVFEIQEPVEQTDVQGDPFDRFHPEYEPEMPRPRKSVVLRLNFEGCNEVKPKGISMLPHRSNFFYGNNSSKWCTNVPNYREIIYEKIYKNIDLRYYSSEKGLKYDFIVHPSGEPNDIKMRYECIEKLSINHKNNLEIQTQLGNVFDSDIFIYQNIENEQIKIDGRFKILDKTTYGFELLTEYEREIDLIIDPLIYSTFIGGIDNETSLGIAIDNDGNAYISGRTYSNNFPVTPNANDTSFNGQCDIFIIKLNSTGASLIYATYIGGTDLDLSNSISIDPHGNAYLAGDTYSIDFPTTSNAYSPTLKAENDIFIIKLNSTGSSILYSTYIGGSLFEFSMDIAIDSDLNVYIVGSTNSVDFPTTLGAYSSIFRYVFILKFNITTSTLLYSTYIGGSDVDYGRRIAVDPNGSVYVTGTAHSSDFPTTSGVYNTSHNGETDVFVLKLNPLGTGSNDLLYSTFIGGNHSEDGYGIIIDSNLNAYVTGWTNSSNFPNTTGAYDNTANGNYDIFFLKLNETGASLIYSTYIGGNSDDGGLALTVDSNNVIYITGLTDSTDFPTTPGAYDEMSNGMHDIFVLKFDYKNSSLIYSSFIGGSSNDYGHDIAIDQNNMTYITGRTDSPNFPVTLGANDTTINGYFDSYILKLFIEPNSRPTAINFSISESSILRTNILNLYSDAIDLEDIKFNLTPNFEYRDSNEKLWNNTYFSNLEYKDTHWEGGFTPSKNATLGVYDFRVRFNDTGGLLSNWIYLNDSLLVLNNLPVVEGLNLSNNSALLDDIISIWINGSDIEEVEENLTIIVEYRDPSEQSWNVTYLNNPIYQNYRWEYPLNIPYNAPIGYYDFRTQCNDSDGNYSAWFYLNDSLFVYNIGPNVIDMQLSKNSVFRTDSVSVYVNSTDYETPENLLIFYAQYTLPTDELDWINLTGEYSYVDNRWELEFKTTKQSILGYYDFRVKFEDSQSYSCGWFYLNDSLEVLNNPPKISEDLDDIEVGIQPLNLDLTQHESDIEDDNENLTWSIESQTYTYIDSIDMIDTINDTLRIVPLENVTGTEDIKLTLTDKDSGAATKLDVTIIVDSTITELTPKVTLLSPPDNTIVNTLIPALKWKLDYSGMDIITYKVILDDTPDPTQELKSGLTTTKHTLETELEDGKTYYWKVLPTNGICISGSFSFTINLDFVPIYKVNLTSEIDSITIKQGEFKEINLKLKNEGNVVDCFITEYRSTRLQSQVSIDKSNVQLEPTIDSTLKLNINIPSDFKIGDYSVIVAATSLSDDTVKDEIIIKVEVVAEDFVPEYDVTISISTTSLDLDKGDTENMTITITNEGNIEDDFNIKFESNEFSSADIQFSKGTLTLNDGDLDQITVTITIPDYMKPGEYTIKFIVESDDASDETILKIIVKSEDDGKQEDGEEDNTILYASIGIIVTIIIIVLILLFLFLRKAKPKEEEPIIEEIPLPPEASAPTYQEIPSEQPPPPETPPKQPPILEVRPQVPQPVVQPSIIQPTVAPIPAIAQPSIVEETVSDGELEE